MKVRGYFLGPPRSTDKTTLIIKVSNGAKIRNRYNQVTFGFQYIILFVLSLSCNDSITDFPISSNTIAFHFIRTLENSEDSDEMPHDAAFHQGLHCLLK